VNSARDPTAALDARPDVRSADRNNATRSASNSSSTNASPEIITVSHSAARANPRSGSIGCRSALCSRPRLLPFLFTAASSSFSNPIFRSGEDCRHFNFNSYPAISALRRHHIEPIVLPAQFLASLLENLRSDTPKSEMMTQPERDNLFLAPGNLLLRLRGARVAAGPLSSIVNWFMRQLVGIVTN
jgi:hypothetical protein